MTMSNGCDQPRGSSGDPPDLVHHSPWTRFDMSLLSTGQLYFYVGAGLSIASGLVGWDEMARMVWRYRTYYEGVKSPCPPQRDADTNAEFLQRLLEERDSKRPPIMSHNSKDPRAFGRAVLLNLILRRRAPRTRLKEEEGKAIPDDSQPRHERSRYGQEPSAEDFALQSLVWRAKCHGVLTPNYDMFLEHAHSLFHHGSALRSYRYNANLLRYIFSNPAFVLKLHGDINDIHTVLLDPRLLWRGSPHGGKPSDLKKVYATALARGHMIYVGLGFLDQTIEKLHMYWRRYWRMQQRGSHYLRVALVPRWEFESRVFDKIKKRDLFQDIFFLTYETESPGQHPSHAVQAFLSRLVEVRRGVRAAPQADDDEAADIHRQMFEVRPGDDPKQHFQTKPWTLWSRRK